MYIITAVICTGVLLLRFTPYCIKAAVCLVSDLHNLAQTCIIIWPQEVKLLLLLRYGR